MSTTCCPCRFAQVMDLGFENNQIRLWAKASARTWLGKLGVLIWLENWTYLWQFEGRIG